MHINKFTLDLTILNNLHNNITFEITEFTYLKKKKIYIRKYNIICLLLLGIGKVHTFIMYSSIFFIIQCKQKHIYLRFFLLFFLATVLYLNTLLYRIKKKSFPF